MDFISHGLVGITIGLLDNKKTKKKILATSFFSVLPDIFQIPYYLGLGYIKDRPFNWPKLEDWTNFRGVHPFLDAFWDIPHSFLFLVIIIIPLVKYFKKSNFYIYAYLSHILLDIPTHTGEWGVKVFYPLNIKLNGFTDAWAWDYDYFFISWASLIVLNIALYKFIHNQEIE